MFTLVRKHSNKDEEQWRPLFYRILQNKITGAHRRVSLRRRLFGNRREEDDDPLDQVAGLSSVEPVERVQLDESTAKLIDLVAELPLRQQQAFLLRTLEGLIGSVAVITLAVFLNISTTDPVQMLPIVDVVELAVVQDLELLEQLEFLAWLEEGGPHAG